MPAPPWSILLRALEVEPLERNILRGASGYPHEVIAAGFDQSRARLIVLSLEGEPRVAAMAQADLQARHQTIQVITARPVFFDISAIGSSWNFSGKDRLSSDDLESQAQKFAAQSALSEIIGENEVATRRQLQELAHQVTLLLSKDKAVLKSESRLADVDRECGICPIPLYLWDLNELESLRAARDEEVVRATLARHGVLQYFFPPVDQLLLGLADRSVGGREQLTTVVAGTPSIGHPLSAPELFPNELSLPEMLDALADRKLVVEGEVSYELTEEGRKARTTVRFKPRESLFTKIINRFSFGMNMSDFFK